MTPFKSRYSDPLYLVLENQIAFKGDSFGARLDDAIIGEVVFNTGMVGYPESFTDPSYRGQILALTYPLIGNYGVPAHFNDELSSFYESANIHLAGLIVSEYSQYHHHWNATNCLSDLLKQQNIVGVQGIDTRALVKILREKGTMAGQITSSPKDAKWVIEPRHMVSEVSIASPKEYAVDGAKKRIALVDCGCKNTIIRSVLSRKVNILQLPWDANPLDYDVDGVLYSNGPGDPQDCQETIAHAKHVLDSNIPVFGICLGNQILASAAGARTYKLKYGHRSQNQPCLIAGSNTCCITSQNHGYAVDATSLPDGWEEWFTNLNDGSNEGIRHTTKPIMAVQFHPEAMPGPVDTGYLFDEFISLL